MRILFDQGTPVPLRAQLGDHQVDTAYERGWSELSNGELLDAAERAGYEMLLTTDTHLEAQQSLAHRSIAVVALRTTSWPRIRAAIPGVLDSIARASPGQCIYVDIP